MRKKVLFLFLALLLCLPVSAAASEGDFQVENGVLVSYAGPGGEVAVPDGVTEIGAYAFAYSPSPTSVRLPAGLTKIGDGAFDGCAELTEIVLPDSVTELGMRVFHNCTALERITLSQGLTQIGSNAFDGCGALTEIAIPDNATTLGGYIFQDCYSLQKVKLPEGLTSLPSGTFSGCTVLTDVALPKTMDSIGESAFAGCTSLAHIDLPNAGRPLSSQIGNYAFSECTCLTEITIPGSIYHIRPNAFQGCTGLTSVVLEDGVQAISTDAFRECPNLTSVTIPGSVVSIGEGSYSVFLQSKQLTIYGEKGSAAETHALRWKIPFVAGKAPSLTGTTPANPTQFSDVPAGAYYASPVKWAVEQKIAKGMGQGTFSPDKTCNQAEILTFLWRANGAPVYEAVPSPIPANAYYAAAVSWGHTAGLIDAQTFAPNAPCTRGDVVTYLWKLNEKSFLGDVSFGDVPADAPYYQAVCWAVKSGITKGTGGGNFSPDKTCTRGEIVTFLYRAYQ